MEGSQVVSVPWLWENRVGNPAPGRIAGRDHQGQKGFGLGEDTAEAHRFSVLKTAWSPSLQNNYTKAARIVNLPSRFAPDSPRTPRPKGLVATPL
jgi:hypothetical protein